MALATGSDNSIVNFAVNSIDHDFIVNFAENSTDLGSFRCRWAGHTPSLGAFEPGDVDGVDGKVYGTGGSDGVHEEVDDGVG